MSVRKYITLIQDFVDDAISADVFEKRYVDLFKNEKEIFSEEIYGALNSLFLDADAYCSDESIRGPEDFDENQLKLSAKKCLKTLT